MTENFKILTNNLSQYVAPEKNVCTANFHDHKSTQWPKRLVTVQLVLCTIKTINRPKHHSKWSSDTPDKDARIQALVSYD